MQGYDYSSDRHAFFVTIRAKRGTAPFANDALAREVAESLEWLRQHRGVAVYAYCLMPDHLHVVMRLPEGGVSLGQVLGAFKRFTTRAGWAHGTQGALWQPSYHDRVVRDRDDMTSLVNYVMDNPVRKGMVAGQDEYAWSGCPDAW